MNSIEDLNNKSNEPIVVPGYQDYLLVFSASAGNSTSSEFTNSFFTLDRQVNIVTLENPFRDIIVTYQVDEPGVIDTVRYVGNNSNIQVYQGTSSSWQAIGIRSIADYNEVFANVYMGTNAATGEEFNVVITVNDQNGNTRSWNQQVTLTENTFIAFGNGIVYNEDTDTRLANLQIIDGYVDPTNYTVVANVAPEIGQFVLPTGNVVQSFGNTFTKAAFNSYIANVDFRPAADVAANVATTFDITRTGDSYRAIFSVPMLIGNVHSEYSAPNSITYSTNAFSLLNDFSITDQRPDNIDANITYTVNFATTGDFVLKYAGNTTNSVTLNGTKSTINAILGNVSLTPGVTSTNPAATSGNLLYTQTQNTDGVLQGNISIPMSSVPTAVHINSGVQRPLGNYVDYAIHSYYYDYELKLPAADFFAYNWENNWPSVVSWYSLTDVHGYRGQNPGVTSTPIVLSTIASADKITGPNAIEIKPNYGLTGRNDAVSNNRDNWYFGFWMKVKQTGEQMLAAINLSMGSWPLQRLGIWTTVGNNNYSFGGLFRTGQTPGNLQYPIWRPGPRFPTAAGFTVNQWFHVALQITATKFSMWLNGYPQEYYFNDGSGQSILNSTEMRTVFGSAAYETKFKNFVFGAPSMPPSGIVTGKPLWAIVDNIEIRNAAPYTDGVAFTPPTTASLWGGTLTQVFNSVDPG